MTDKYIVDRGVVAGATSIHNVNPAMLIEKITRERIFESMYWKQHCFGLSAATLCDRAAELTYVGGVYANLRVSPFLCLLFKIIQLQPENEIILEYLRQPHFKYLSALAAFYVRLFFPPAEIYATLEPMYADYRKLKFRTAAGVALIHMDEFIDQLLTQARVCETSLPRLPKREALEDDGQLEPREPLLSDLDDD